jgi:2,3-bisphosphoglycerate-dependent phosphoglycerate mutase
MTSQLILLRHGQSTWNLENLFSGWVDVDLTEVGVAEGIAAGELLAAEGIRPDIVHTSVLLRAIKTANVTLEAMDMAWLPVTRHWRLNERHYGALQGLNKAQTAAEHGAEQVLIWRRSYDIPPPALDLDDERHPRHDRRYHLLAPEQLPATECLKDVVERMLPYWFDAIIPDLADGHTVLVAAHGNSLRALVKHLNGISDEEIPGLNIPTGQPLVYELGDDFHPLEVKPVAERYLADPEEVQRAAQAVADQAKG